MYKVRNLPKLCWVVEATMERAFHLAIFYYARIISCLFQLLSSYIKEQKITFL